MNIYVIIPAYNEEKRIWQVLKDLSFLPYQVVVVDDASTDQTVAVVRPFPVTLLRHKINRDQGAALQTGNQYALEQGADIIVHFDADGQFVATEIEEMIAPIVSGHYDVVFGSRFLGKHSKMPWLKKSVILPIARLVNKIVLHIELTDPQNGFRVLSRKAAQQISIEQDGKAHCSEIIAKAFGQGLKVKEVPVTVIYHHFGQGFGDGWRILKDLLLSKIIK